MSTNSRISLIAAISTALLVSGCATTQEGQQQAFGAGLGCVVAGAAAAIITRDARYAAAACAAGAAAGFAAVKIQQYNATQARTSDADIRRYRKSDPDFYGLRTTGTTAAVKIRNASISPGTVKPGSAVVAKTDYSVVTPPNVGTVDVTESWTLKKDGKTLASPTPPPQSRNDGGWVTDGTFTIPTDATPGTYIVEHKVQTGTSYDIRTSSFVVN